MSDTPNEVFLHPDGYIEVKTVGIQSPTSVRAMGEQIAQLAQELRDQHKPVLVLDNLTKMALKQSNDVPKAVAAEARRLDYDKVAMLGAGNRLLKYGAQFIIRAVGFGQKIKYFDSREQAVAWLKQI